MQKRLAIFDLDGTLLNTIADLAMATNQALEKCGFPIHPIEAYPMFVGNGINKLFERALPSEARTEENILRVRAHFLPYYDEHNADLSTPYPGIVALLEQIQEAGIQLAVASNKYQRATEKLIRHYFPRIRFATIFGQREGVPVKPHPQVVEDILAIVPTKKEEVIYIGDSGVDMQTALNAGVQSIGVTWGFRPKEELMQHSPTYLVDRAEEMVELIFRDVES
ncbi:MAG: HAD family hydrolase [Bacteroidaceae bacterium]|nr:HAD family hydrolase [Bacteroidaceae bacterium]